jgi:myo-inositol-hexaphosphate 3-phosphohydrolase
MMKAMLKTASVLVMVVALLVPVAAQAHTVITHEIKDGTVIYAHENQLLVEMSDGSARLVDVDPDFRFDMDGKKVATGDLEPGMKLKASVTVTQTPRVVKVTEIKEGTIVSIVGQTVTIRTADGVKMFKNVPSDLKFSVHGKMVPINKITEGMKITATQVVEEVEIETDRDVKVKAKQPKN